MRIAINVGEVNLAENDVFGEAVNIAARIESVTQAGEVFFTEAVYLSMNKTEVPSSEVGLLKLKGISEKVKVYKVKRERPVGGKDSVSPKAKKQIFDFFRSKGAPFPDSGKAFPARGRKPSSFKRFVALLIDAAFCLMFVSMLFPGKRTHIHFSHKMKADSAAEPAERQFPAGETSTEGEIAEEWAEEAGPETLARETWKEEIPAGEEYDYLGGEILEEEIVGKTKNWTISKRKKKKNIIFPLVWMTYSTLFLGMWSVTPGKKIMGLAVRGMNGLPLSWKDAFARSLFTLVSGYFVFLGFIWALWEKDKRGWHDLLAETMVVPLGRDD